MHWAPEDQRAWCMRNLILNLRLEAQTWRLRPTLTHLAFGLEEGTVSHYSDYALFT